MQLRARLAQSADYHAACRLWAEADALHARERPDRFRPTDQPARSRRLFDAHLADTDQALFVAEVNGDVVGLVRVQAMERAGGAGCPGADRPRRYAMVQELVVAQSHQRRGIATRLMTEAHRWARDRGVTEVGLSVYEFNQAALRLYHQAWLLDRQPPTRPQARLRGHRCVEWITGYRLRSAPMTSVHCGPLAVGAALRCRLRCGCPRGIRIHRAIGDLAHAAAPPGTAACLI